MLKRSVFIKPVCSFAEVAIRVIGSQINTFRNHHIITRRSNYIIREKVQSYAQYVRSLYRKKWAH